jgi:nucleotide-binding universal stress UspA family protein
MKRFKHILYVAEVSVAQEVAVARAVSLAQNNQAHLTVIDVVREVTAGIGMPPGGPISADLTAAKVAQRRQELEALLGPYRGQVHADIEVLVGRKFLEVIRAVLRTGHDLVIKPAENPGWIDRLFGSDDMHLLRKCPCPVWLMRPEEKTNYDCILAAVGMDPDGQDSEEQALNQAILQLAGSLALSDFAQLHLVHVWDAPEAGFASLWADNAEAAEINFTQSVHAHHKRKIEGLTRELRQHIGDEAYAYLSPRVHMPRGRAETEVPALARKLNADLVVMGTVARTGIPGLIIGNTAEAVLDQLERSVLAIKPPGFVSPVTLA